MRHYFLELVLHYQKNEIEFYIEQEIYTHSEYIMTKTLHT